MKYLTNRGGGGNVQRPTSNVQRPSQKLLLLLLLFAILYPQCSILAENSNVVDHQLKDAKPLPVKAVGTGSVIATPVRGAPTDRSGTITTGGTSQTLAAALTTRTYIEIQNISDETMYINFGAAAVVDSNSFKIVAGGSYINGPHFCPTGTITIIGATTGKKFVAKEG